MSEIEACHPFSEQHATLFVLIYTNYIYVQWIASEAAFSTGRTCLTYIRLLPPTDVVADVQSNANTTLRSFRHLRIGVIVRLHPMMVHTIKQIARHQDCIQFAIQERLAQPQVCQRTKILFAIQYLVPTYPPKSSKSVRFRIWARPYPSGAVPFPQRLRV